MTRNEAIDKLPLEKRLEIVANVMDEVRSMLWKIDQFYELHGGTNYYLVETRQLHPLLNYSRAVRDVEVALTAWVLMQKLSDG